MHKKWQKKTSFSKLKKRIYLFGMFLNRNMFLIVACMIIFGITCGTVFASNGVAPLWKTVIVLIHKWVNRLGGVIMFVGGVTFGLGFMEDNPDGKSRGASILIAGGLVIAIGNMAASL